MSRSVEIVLLCEDLQQACFARRFLMRYRRGSYRFRVVLPPGGSGEQWVRERFPEELGACRRRQARAETCLLVITDADVRSPAERVRDCQRECDRANMGFRTPAEQVAFAVPARNIESWIAYLRGTAVDEATVYPRLRFESDCQDAVEALHAMCQAGALREPAPASLRHACDEFKRLKL